MCNAMNSGRLEKRDGRVPDAMKALWAVDRAVLADEELTPRKQQPMGVSVALNSEAPYCVELHTHLARNARAGDAQLSEAASISADIRAGCAIAHAADVSVG
jgi:AhpD family alkylhydroperoxidase